MPDLWGARDWLSQPGFAIEQLFLISLPLSHLLCGFIGRCHALPRYKPIASDY
jgi:hypothetical protein